MRVQVGWNARPLNHVRCANWNPSDLKVPHGRVIVRCCDIAAKSQAKWITLIMQSEKGTDPLKDATKGLCELIRSHVEIVTGRTQLELNCDTCVKACETWMSETKSYFDIPDDTPDDMNNPLIIFDTCEVLGERNNKN